MKRRNKIKVLAIDDDEEALEITVARLEVLGYEVVSTQDGVEGISLVRRENPDIILLDIMMPKIDGFSVCKILKEDNALKSIPVILLTSKELINDVEKGFASGADDYVIKPVDWDRLVAKIDKLMSEKK